MSAKNMIRSSIQSSEFIINAYTDGLSDRDLLVRAVPGMNHIAWQLGHLIVAENQIANLVQPGSSPALPEGFAEAYTRETTKIDDPSKFHTLAEYQSIWKTQRAATLAVFDAVPESDYGRTDEKFPQWAKTVGELLVLVGNHPLMHAGQFVAVRRLLDKPVAI